MAGAAIPEETVPEEHAGALGVVSPAALSQNIVTPLNSTESAGLPLDTSSGSTFSRMCASFALLNYLLLLSWQYTNPFGAEPLRLGFFFGWLTLALCVVSAAGVLLPLSLEAFNTLRKFSVNSDVLRSGALGLLFLGAIGDTLLRPHGIGTQDVQATVLQGAFTTLPAVFLICAFLVAMIEWFRGELVASESERTECDLQNRVRWAYRSGLLAGGTAPELKNSAAKNAVNSALRDTCAVGALQIGDHVQLSAIDRTESRFRLFSSRTQVAPEETADPRLVPCDGKIVRGSVELLEMVDTGRTRLRVKGEGDALFAGSRIVRGSCEMEVTACFEDRRGSFAEEQYAQSIATLSERNRSLRKISRIIHSAALMITFVVAESWFLREQQWRVMFGNAAGVLFLFGYMDFIFGLLTNLPRFVAAGLFQRGILLRDVTALFSTPLLRSFAFDYDGVRLQGPARIHALEVLDARVDEKAVLNVLVSLLGAVDDELFDMPSTQPLFENAREKLGAGLEFIRIEQVRTYTGLGVCGRVTGAEFTFGTEEFLIRRGVQFEISEVYDQVEGHVPLYLAVNDGVVARIILERPAKTFGRALVALLRELKLRPVLMGSQPQKDLDEVGKEWGFDLAEIHGEVRGEEYRTRLQELAPVALYGGAGTDSVAHSVADLTIEQFDPIVCNYGRSDLTLFGPETELLPIWVQSARRLRGLLVSIPTISIAIGVAVLLALCLIPISAYFIIAGWCIGIGVLGLLGTRANA